MSLRIWKRNSKIKPSAKSGDLFWYKYLNFFEKKWVNMKQNDQQSSAFLLILTLILTPMIFSFRLMNQTLNVDTPGVNRNLFFALMRFFGQRVICAKNKKVLNLYTLNSILWPTFWQSSNLLSFCDRWRLWRAACCQLPNRPRWSALSKPDFLAASLLIVSASWPFRTFEDWQVSSRTAAPSVDSRWKPC